MPDFRWDSIQYDTIAYTHKNTLGGNVSLVCVSSEPDVYAYLTFAEMDELAVAWLRWRADHAPADIERLLAAAERTQEGGE